MMKAMKGYACNAIFVSLLLLLLLLPFVMSARHIGRQHSGHGHHPASSALVKPDTNDKKRHLPSMNHQRKPVTVQIAGSSLPDCSHACGSCSPCRLVMVSFICASIEEAETCPMAYKCMCHNKSYPVP